MRKYIPYIFAMALSLVSCSREVAEMNDVMSDEDLYIAVDMNGCPATRISYAYDPYFYEDEEEGNITARWELGDVLRVYETEEANSLIMGDVNYTDVYPEYEDYEHAYPYPSAPIIDKYYRFECVGGQGTSHGIFKYVGLTTATVVAGTETHDTYNVNLDIIYKHKIRNWEKFDGLVIHGSPLRNYMMRHQSSNGDFQHLKYGVRLKGHFCSYNFNTWYNGSANDDTGANGLLLYVTESCVFRVLLGGLERELYGGGEITLSLPGVAPDPNDDTKSEFRKYPLSLKLGNIQEHQENKPAWCEANPDGAAAHTKANTVTAYVVGWDGTINAKDKDGKDLEIVVSLKDNFHGIEYTWKKTLAKDFVLTEGHYYTIDLRRKPDVIDNSLPPYIPD